MVLVQFHLHKHAKKWYNSNRCVTVHGRTVFVGIVVPAYASKVVEDL